jgi:hypothetical protein
VITRDCRVLFVLMIVKWSEECKSASLGQWVTAPNRHMIARVTKIPRSPSHYINLEWNHSGGGIDQCYCGTLCLSAARSGVSCIECRHE